MYRLINLNRKEDFGLEKDNITIDGKTLLITGAAGFIGYHLIKMYLRNKKNITIIGIDNMNDYYDCNLKRYRIDSLNKINKTSGENKWIFLENDISDNSVVRNLFEKYQPQIVINLAAQAGVRYSISNPDKYIESNIIGFYNILEACRNSYGEYENGVEHLVYASSSSVYGGNKKLPYSTQDRVDNPVSLYAATKKSNELMAHSYSKLYNIPSTGLRFFTVYGPFGRPDMAYYGFTEKLVDGEMIQLFNYGDCSRDFTYIDDIVQGIETISLRPPKKNIGTDDLPIPPYSIYNIGNSHPENLKDFVEILSEELIKAEVLPKTFDINDHIELVPMQPGDVISTYADITSLQRDFNFSPKTSLREGLSKFAVWFKNYYKIN